MTEPPFRMVGWNSLEQQSFRNEGINEVVQYVRKQRYRNATHCRRRING